MFFPMPSARTIWSDLAVVALMSGSVVATPTRAEVTSPVLAINDEAATSDITVEVLRGNVSLVMGSGGNITVLSEREGKLLVDGGIAASKAKLSEALAAIGSGTPRYLINTHWHWDHTDGNAWLHDAGATVVAQQNTLRHLSRPTRVIEWGYTFPPSSAAGLPTVTFDTRKTIPFGDEIVELAHYGPGHTDGDAMVYFKKADVLAMGDTWWNGHYPFIDYGAGGSIDGMIRWANAGIEKATPRTIIIPGHGPVGDRSQLIAYRDMLVGVRSAVARLKARGKSLAEVIAARPTMRYDAKWGDFVIDPAFFIQLVYTGV
jgi:glyoxylase-like metal-dependent hydrolase (beta-lactamase superfamily II)